MWRKATRSMNSWSSRNQKRKRKNALEDKDEVGTAFLTLDKAWEALLSPDIKDPSKRLPNKPNDIRFDLKRKWWSLYGYTSLVYIILIAIIIGVILLSFASHDVYVKKTFEKQGPHDSLMHDVIREQINMRQQEIVQMQEI